MDIVYTGLRSMRVLWADRFSRCAALLRSLSCEDTAMGLLSGKRPTDLGVKKGRLKPAPRSPNAVSSQAADVQHKIAPLSYQSLQAQAMEALVKIIEATPRTRIVTRSADYLHAEYESALLGFVDDVEFYFEPGSKLLQVCSASRLGYSDFGVNRARIEDIRRRLLDAKA